MKKIYSVEVIRGAMGDSSKGGITSKTDMLTLFDKNWSYKEIERYCEEKQIEKNLCVQLEMCGDYKRAAVVFKDGKHLYVFSGNYVIGDSRFRNEINRYPIAVIDRVETQEEYNVLSR